MNLDDEGEREVVDARGLNTDELLRLMELDEAEDAPLITPVDYAKIRPFSPQQVYYHLRKGHFKKYICPCGRTTIVKEEADAYFRSVGKLQPKMNNTGPVEP
jgi:hypothetical protein